ncbi:MAG TPA: CDP-alcohol phosphatidyltransferase family protein [Patescibacteria group bacterium]
MSQNLNWPNTLSIIRLILAVVFLVFLLQFKTSQALIIFIIALMTDWADGYIARKKGQVTILGKILDPLADKLLFIIAFVSLSLNYALPVWVAWIVVGCYIILLSGGVVFVKKGISILKHSWLGRGAFALQAVVVAGVLLSYSGQAWLTIIIYLMVFLTASTCYYYLAQGFKLLKK